MVLLVLAGWIGGAATVVALWSYSPLVALVAAPFGGSTLAALMATVLFVLRSDEVKEPGREGPQASLHLQ
jgi:hypothetical protein